MTINDSLLPGVAGLMRIYQLFDIGGPDFFARLSPLDDRLDKLGEQVKNRRRHIQNAFRSLFL
jgi:hypothetical protein